MKAIAASLLTLLGLIGLMACKPARAPSSIVAEGRQLLADGRTENALEILERGVSRHPSVAELRIELAYAQNSVGQYVAAEATLERARDLGALLDEVRIPTSISLLGQGKPDAALAVIGEQRAWSRAQTFPLTVLSAEAQLRRIGADPRAVRRAFAAAFHAQATALGGEAPGRDAIDASARLAMLRKTEPLVRDAAEHVQCHAELAPTVPMASTPIDSRRRVLEVGPSRELKTPSSAAAIAGDGDIIAIDAGDYPADVAVWRQNGLLLRGMGGRVRLDSRGKVAAQQGIWVFRGNDIIVEGIEFSGARGPGRNGSGIRFLGRNLTVRDCVFRDNEAGLLTWKDPESDILVEHSVFFRNGYGDGQSHNIYIGQIRRFTLRFSHSHDSHIGHEVKSRARTNYILYNRLTDEDDGDSSYLVDLPQGGDGYVIGNELLKGARADNPNAISYAAEAPDVAFGQLWVANNTFWNRHPYAVFVRNASQRPAVIANNVVAGAPALLLKGPGTEVTNYAAQSPGLRNPGQLDFALTADSPVIDEGTDLRGMGGEYVNASFEYVHPAGGRTRKRVGPLDIGAAEFCGW
jgi:hypothetical protein